MKTIIIVGLSLSLLAGCATLKRATGQIDDTVLPGQRQEILPPDQQQARDPSITGQPAPPSTMPAQPPVIAPTLQQANRSVAPGNPAPLAPPAPPADAAAIAACDPKVDLCPEALPPEPLPPPSPLIPEKMKVKAAAKGKVGMEKVADAKPMAKKLVKKKVLKKKLPSKPAAVPATPDVTPPVAEPPKPQSQ